MPVETPLYPVNLLLAGRSCLVVGGGRVAAQKVRGLVAAGAVVTVVAPDIVAEIAALGVRCERRRYRRPEAADYRLVVAATGDTAVNQQVYDDAEAAGVWVNSADDPARCTVTLPAVVRQGHLTVTVSTGGHSPALSAWLREQFAAELGPEYDQLIGVLADVRSEIQTTGRATESLDWRRALQSGILDLVRAGQIEEAKERLRACLLSSSD
ncbi:MAG: precorrin-2 dehydrogenase/sirohydrochlorin ferrochelatase family protein [Acidimicrobiales bacterium]